MNANKPIPRSYAILAAVLIFGVLVGGLWQLGVFNTTASTPTPIPTPGPTATFVSEEFDADQAYTHVVAQMDLGPRITGTEASVLAGDYIAKQLQQFGWQVEFQAFSYKDTPVRNVIAKTNIGQGPVIILGAHYDSRRRADQDPEHLNDPVPGAVDGASGVAVLLELARTLDKWKIKNEIWLAFFDAEDNGDLDGWEWIVGSAYMAEQLAITPQAMILLDMVADQDQQFYYENNSNPELSAKVWETAAQLGYSDHFIPQPRWSMEDDHIPFVRRGIPSLDIIDFDYPHWHKITDTIDKISIESLGRVGRTVEVFLETVTIDSILLSTPTPSS
jgi:glutaminyl-peptide cyclotransferase